VTDEIALDIQEVSKAFGATNALERVTLQVHRGEFLTLLGPSGSGKTTLLRMIVGFESPTAGRILLGGRDISGLSPADRSAGMVFQQYALFPHMTVADNIAYGLKLRRWPRAKQRERVAEMLDLVRLEGYEARYPRQLSGGQQQRVALARALAYDPEIILMDEPLGALDRALRIEMEQVIRRIHRDLEATVVYVTHDQQEALALSDRIAIMRDGRLQCVDTPEELYYRPASSFVASFFASSNLLPVTLVERLGPDSARVRYGQDELSCRVAGEIAGPVQLAVRRRSLRREPSPNCLVVRGTVAETLLFGDEREVILDVPDAGRVVALIAAHAAADLAVGQPVELYVPPEETVLVTDVDAGAPGAAGDADAPLQPDALAVGP
jgi:putative spermidine/putrescine transport system ATP-binding protein